MSNEHDDQRFDDAVRSYLDWEAAQLPDRPSPVQMAAAVADQGADAGRSTHRGPLTPILIMLMAALVLAAVVGITVAAGWLRLSREVQPTPAPTLPAHQTAVGLQWHGTSIALKDNTTYGFALGTTDVGVEFTASGNDWGWEPLIATADYRFLFSDWGAVGFALADDVYTDPCHRTSGTAGVGPGVDDFIAGIQESLTGIPGIAVRPPRDGTVAGVHSKELTLTFTSGFDASGCDLRSILLWHAPGDLDGIPYGRPVGEGSQVLGARLDSDTAPTVELFVLDVHGTRVLLEVDLVRDPTSWVDDPVALLVDSIRFTDASQEPAVRVPTLPPTATSPFSAPTPMPGGFLVPDVPYSVWLDSRHQIGLKLRVPDPLEWIAETGPNMLVISPYGGGMGMGPYLEVAVPSQVYRDPCRPATGVDDAGRTSDVLARQLRQALGKMTGADVSATRDATIGGLIALEFDFTVPESGRRGCGTPPALWTLPSGPDPLSVRPVSEVFVVDVHGTLAVVTRDVSTDAEGAAIGQIVDSFRWK
jgi:hypothetical protein